VDTKITNIILLAIIVLAFGAGIFVYPMLPDQIASHWGPSGQVNGYMPKLWGIFLFPLILIGMFVFYIAIPMVDPLKKNIESFRKDYNKFWIFMFVFFSYVFSLTLAWNFGCRFNMTFAIIPAIAMLYYVMAAIIEKSKRNWFFGIRTPWTLSSDRVWDKMHKLGGKLYRVAAFLSLAGLLFTEEIAIFFIVGPVMIASIYVLVYSYFVYKKNN